ncbi:DUF2913 family protein [Vibrio genomosp. F10]|uniref:Alpha-acetolactate decarboxylase n=3 Tax=Vibrio genomosp. F10 TaxID=723171 RepID=A0A1B9QZV0_9VIBR|nr:DUF2913 family protein [Vibrio genomosp. F10]OCH76296.1 alpha-acetolactate decarboxylase [Vibrio genomosp. F10]OEE32652.1 alpha-acetolactate decarboxylase [Vibrio genomosp. F10 str. ZF-129]OEE98382.1 alpha-acetolactate decarboxylase [Vibrio genomosp. F10 str. 9ZC157]OEF07624.1 alpha-acetolactate decarboxylase [Vibrio genomosp. F10 str. 9ZB36]
MSNYTVEIQKVVNLALAEMQAEHASGKLADAPIANNHFLVRWVTKALKSQRFERCVVDDLIRWQKSGRSKGDSAGLPFIFKRISVFYAQFFQSDELLKELKDSDIETFLDVMIAANWDVSTSEPLIGGGKVQIFTDGHSSLALCANQCDDCFEGELLTQPMHWFVRGNHAEFIEKSAAAGFMVHKVTDYKSVVKYHGEYVIFPRNQGNQLAEIPLNLKID